MYSRLSKSNQPTLSPVELTEYNPSTNNDQPNIIQPKPISSLLYSNNDNDLMRSKKEAIIRLRNIHKTYLLGLEGVPALRGVSVTINRGEFIVILGKSGGGKTSMLNIMGTIDKPTKGDIYISGKRISNKTGDTEVANLRLKRIGFCFQTFNLIGSMTALENVELPMILNGELTSKQIRERAMKLLTHVGLANRAGHLPSQLSGGEQQRVTISRAVANNPDVLLLDEPTGDLDTKNSNIIMDLLVKLNRDENITCIFVTHDVALKYYAHRVIHMLDGKISKIEIISKKRRLAIEKELQENILNDNNPNRKDKDCAIEIEIREPLNFYPYLSFKKKYDIKQNILKQKKLKKKLLRKSQKGYDYDDNTDSDNDYHLPSDDDEYNDINDDGKDDDNIDDDDDDNDNNIDTQSKSNTQTSSDIVEEIENNVKEPDDLSDLIN